MADDLVLKDRYKRLQQQIERDSVEVASRKAKKQSLIRSKKMIVDRLLNDFGINNKDNLLNSIEKERLSIIHSCYEFISSVRPFLNKLAQSNKVKMPPPDFFSVNLESLDIANLTRYSNDLAIFQNNLRSYLGQAEGMVQAMSYQRDSLFSSIRQKTNCNDIGHAKKILAEMNEQMRIDIEYAKRHADSIDKELNGNG
jgi:hypothetical protein